MRASTVPRPQDRMTSSYSSSLNIINYDRDNLYPNVLMNLVGNSPTASGCLSRYAAFIEGNGLHSQTLASAVINRNGQTLDEVHQLVAMDKAQFDGFALLMQYDVTLHVSALYHLPFEQCRLMESDKYGNISHVAVHPDWTGRSTRDGERVAVSEDNVKMLPVFNPDPAVVARQIKEAGGITRYDGQVYYYSGEGAMTYPKPRYDAALTDISTDEGISNVMNRNARSSFLPSGAFVFYANDDRQYRNTMSQIAAMQGDMNTGAVLGIAIENKDEEPKFLPIRGNNYDKDFTATTSAVTERIYSAFGQEGWYRLRTGSVGFAGDIVKDIETEYSKQCAKDQRMLSKAYMAILSHFAEGVLPEQPTIQALTIEPYSSITTTTTAP